jgi:hypothetical protein
LEKRTKILSLAVLVLVLPLFIALFLKKDKILSFLVPWLVLYPLPNSLTQFGAIARMFVLLPLPQILSAVGLVFIFPQLALLKKFVRFSLVFILVLIVIFSFTRFVFDYFLYYPLPYAPVLAKIRNWYVVSMAMLWQK